MKRYIILFLFFFLPACTEIIPLKPVIENEYKPDIDSKVEALMGDIMIHRTAGDYRSGFEFASDYKLWKWTTFRGTKWAVIGKLSSDGSWVIKNSSSYEEILPRCYSVNDNGELINYSEYCSPIHFYPIDNKKPILIPIKKIWEKGAFSQELLYNGKSGKTIKVLYREFRDDMIRPSFTQDLTYDLSEGPIIGFRGMKIEVLEATNSSIKFIVRSKMHDEL